MGQPDANADVAANRQRQHTSAELQASGSPPVKRHTQHCPIYAKTIGNRDFDDPAPLICSASILPLFAMTKSL